MKITQEELDQLRATTSPEGWMGVVATIKTARKGALPPDWSEVVIVSGLLQATQETWALGPNP